MEKEITYIEYEVWGNNEDGYEVNNLFKLLTLKVKEEKLKRLAYKQILKLFHNKVVRMAFSSAVLKIDFRRIAIDNQSGDNFIEFCHKKTGQPLGRVEID